MQFHRTKARQKKRICPSKSEIERDDTSYIYWYWIRERINDNWVSPTEFYSFTAGGKARGRSSRIEYFLYLFQFIRETNLPREHRWKVFPCVVRSMCVDDGPSIGDFDYPDVYGGETWPKTETSIYVRRAEKLSVSSLLIFAFHCRVNCARDRDKNQGTWRPPLRTRRGCRVSLSARSLVELATSRSCSRDIERKTHFR